MTSPSKPYRTTKCDFTRLLSLKVQGHLYKHLYRYRTIFYNNLERNSLSVKKIIKCLENLITKP